MPRGLRWSQQLASKLAYLLAVAACSSPPLRAQDLSPRAYVITPIHANAITLTYGFYDGGLLFGSALPIHNASGTYNVPVFSYYHSFNMFGHFANIVAALPYAVGNFDGDVGKVPTWDFTAPGCSTQPIGWR